MRYFIKTVLLLAAFSLTGATAPGSSPEGFWLTEKHDGIVQIYRCAGGGDTLCGRLAWFHIRPDDPQPTDRNNPDPSLRDRPLCGLPFIAGFQPAGLDRWENGSIYDPESGNSYHARITLRDDGALSLRGYIGVPLLGRSEVWTRYTQPAPACGKP